MDELKRFVDRHRQEFEIHEEDYDQLWENIDRELRRSHRHVVRHRFGVVMKVAASVALLVGFGLAFLMGMRASDLRQHGIALMNISEEMADTEVYYVQEINDKLFEIEQYAGEVDARLLEQLEKLDDDYQMLKKDLRDNADNEEVINAMIEYYRLKLSMLEKVLSQIKVKSDQDEVHNI
jgi:hypothetical protein